MRPVNVILVTCGNAFLAENGHLDRLITALLNTGRNPILVLGPDGDEVIQHCQNFEKCDMVFDPNYEGQFFSAVKAGLHATKGACFVISSAADPESVQAMSWLESESHKRSHEPIDVIRFVTQTITDELRNRVDLVTARGVSRLLTLPAQSDWENDSSVAWQAFRTSLYLSN